MEVGEYHLTFAYPTQFLGLRLLDLDDHVGAVEDLLRGGKDRRACVGIGGVIKTSADAGTCFDNNLMSLVHRLVSGIRGHADAEFLWLDFFGATDFHEFILLRVHLNYGTPLDTQLGTDYGPLSPLLFEYSAAYWSFHAKVLRHMSLDDIDRRILTALQRNGRMSNSDLSEKVHLSPSACHRRVQRLEAEGYIRDYVALLNPRKMGVPTTVFVEITLQGQADEVLDAFEKAVARIPDVLECHLMAGAADYLLKVVAENTEDFARIHRQHLARLPGVGQMQSSFALRTVCNTTALPVG